MEEPNNETKMMISMNEEEMPPFRQVGRKTEVMAMPMVLKPKIENRLNRDDSSSSTAASTEGTSSSGRSNSSTNNYVQIKEDSCDGDWLCQLQHRLYSRKEEEDLLLQTYLQRRRTSSIRKRRENGSGLCLISGASGVGKARLARTLGDRVREEGGYFLSTKFSQMQQGRPGPTTPFVEAFTDFTNAILAQGPEVVETTRQNICEALGDELPVLLSGIPVLERIVGKPEGEPVHMSCQMAQRFVFALQDLLGAVCTPHSPMVILFDGLHFATTCGLKVLKPFIAGNQNPHLFVVGTCDDTVGPCSPISTVLRELEDEDHQKISHVEVTQKPCNVVRQIITEILPMKNGRYDALAKLVCAQTRGNPLYVVEFLRWLFEEKLLQYDSVEGTWILYDEDVRLSIDSCQLGDFLIDKLEQLPENLQEVIRVAACLGHDVNENLLRAVFPADVVSDRLHDATSRGIFVYDADTGYSFRHDGLQNAAMALVPAQEKEAFHLRLGRKILEALDEKDREEHIHLILGQLRLGSKMIHDKDEKRGVAMLCFGAGQASARASSFPAAASYFGFGIEMTEPSWDGDYTLKLALYNAAAEMELANSNFERVHELLQVVFDNVPTLKQKLQAYNTLILAYGMTDKQHLAVETGVDVLAQLGETFPTKNCMAALRKQMRSVDGLLKGKSDAQIMRMEMIKDEEKLAALQILNLMVIHAAMVKPTFAPFIQLKSIEITMKHGLSALASVAFASYGMLCTAVGKFDQSFRYGQLSLDLLKKFRSKQYLPRVFAAVYGCISPFHRPITETIQPLKRGQEVGSQTGDIECACLDAALYSAAVFFSDSTLQDVSALIENIMSMMKNRRQDSLLLMLTPFHQLTLSLMGLTEDPSKLSNDLKLSKAFKHAEETKNASSLVCLRLQNMILGYLFGNFEQAGEMVDEIESLTYPPPGIDAIFCKFFVGMTHLASARRCSGIKRLVFLRKAKKTIREFKTWSLNSPHNCLCMKYLLEAELASFQGKPKRAYEKYTASTALAVDAGFQMIEAMSHEHAGRHLFATGDESLAAASFRKALSCYEKWGAKAKHQHLEAEINDIFSYSSEGFDRSERTSCKK